MSENEIRFAEWQILHDNIDRFPDLLRETKRVIPESKVTIFGAGQPRCCHIVVTLSWQKRSLRKIIVIDIRDGSCETWLEKFDAKEWSAAVL